MAATSMLLYPLIDVVLNKFKLYPWTRKKCSHIPNKKILNSMIQKYTTIRNLNNPVNTLIPLTWISSSNPFNPTELFSSVQNNGWKCLLYWSVLKGSTSGWKRSSESYQLHIKKFSERNCQYCKVDNIRGVLFSRFVPAKYCWNITRILSMLAHRTYNCLTGNSKPSE